MREVKTLGARERIAGPHVRLINDIERYPDSCPGCTGAAVLSRSRERDRRRACAISAAACAIPSSPRAIRSSPTAASHDAGQGAVRELRRRVDAHAHRRGGCRVELDHALRFRESALGDGASSRCSRRAAASLVDAFVARARESSTGIEVPRIRCLVAYALRDRQYARGAVELPASQRRSPTSSLRSRPAAERFRRYRWESAAVGDLRRARVTASQVLRATATGSRFCARCERSARAARREGVRKARRAAARFRSHERSLSAGAAACCRRAWRPARDDRCDHLLVLEVHDEVALLGRLSRPFLR